MTPSLDDDLVYCTWTHRANLPPVVRDKFGDLDQLLRQLAISARKSILIVAPYLSPAGLRGLKNALGVAAQNGATVKLVTGSLDADGGRNQKALTALLGGETGALIGKHLRVLNAAESLPVLLHAKVVIADGCRGYIGSANLSWHAMESNLEVGVLLSHRQAETLEQLVAYLEGRSMLVEVHLS
ncbi:MAG: phospholipase D-like domain-containing protein [Candidatus Dormibacteria bacterium]